jgi:hypothetical protein
VPGASFSAPGWPIYEELKQPADPAGSHGGSQPIGACSPEPSRPPRVRCNSNTHDQQNFPGCRRRGGRGDRPARNRAGARQGGLAGDQAAARRPRGGRPAGGRPARRVHAQPHVWRRDRAQLVQLRLRGRRRQHQGRRHLRRLRPARAARAAAASLPARGGRRGACGPLRRRRHHGGQLRDRAAARRRGAAGARVMVSRRQPGRRRGDPRLAVARRPRGLGAGRSPSRLHRLGQVAPPGNQLHGGERGVAPRRPQGRGRRAQVAGRPRARDGARRQHRRQAVVQGGTGRGAPARPGDERRGDRAQLPRRRDARYRAPQLVAD